MANSEKINAVVSRDQKIENFFLNIYIKEFVKKFRNYNTDEFVIAVSGLKKFIPKNDENFTWLIDQLNASNFILVFEGNNDSIKEFEITCKNITKNISFNFKYQIQNLPTVVELSSKTDIPAVGIIIMKIVALVISQLKLLYKAIVLDLDDTLWDGTLSEVGTDKIRENLMTENGSPFIQFMKFVSTLGKELGVFIAVCSRNDSKMVETTIDILDESIFPLKNQIDLIIANNNDKSENIIMIAEQLSILPSSIIFIDDNQIVRDEVKHKLIDVFVPEWSNHSELVTQLIAACIFERSELSLNSQNRRKQKKILQAERIRNSLPKLSIKIYNDDKHTEAIKLYSKSNQFKFSRLDYNFNNDSKSIYFEIIRENGENLGICSALTFSQAHNTFYIHNWAISCRYFELGLEEFLLLYIQKMAVPHKILFNYQHTEYNNKVNEMLTKYSNAFKENELKNTIEMISTNEIIETFSKNTNLVIVKNGKK